ncbi:hypothetical protein [Sphingobacterium sp. SGG-5]|nr:hypothetical protein [Sphingobacterium sp. SGG-5]
MSQSGLWADQNILWGDRDIPWYISRIPRRDVRTLKAKTLCPECM